MGQGRGVNEKFKTPLPNGYVVSTVKVDTLDENLKTVKMWETMVFNPQGEEVYCHREKYKKDAENHHRIAVVNYMK